nr:alpha/beta hydrolases superfamily protein [Tanacetum cinerariifolium]
MVMEKNSGIVKGKKDKYKSIALKAKIKSSDEDTSTSSSEDEEYAMAMRDFKSGECPKSPWKNQKSFVGGSWSDGGEDDEEPKKDEACLMAQETNE